MFQQMGRKENNTLVGIVFGKYDYFEKWFVFTITNAELQSEFANIIELWKSAFINKFQIQIQIQFAWVCYAQFVYPQ